MKKILFLLVNFLPLFLLSQDKITFYDYGWKECKQVDAMYFSIIEKTDSLYHRQDFYLQQKMVQMDGYYLDSACKIKHGKFNYYYYNGKPESVVTYKNDHRNGLRLSYYLNGAMKDSSNYEEGNYTGISCSWYPNGMIKDSVEKVTDNRYINFSWHDNGVPFSAGYRDAAFKEDGVWKYFYKNGKVASKERYKSGELLEKQYFTEDGFPISDTASIDRDATFPGGLKEWAKYLLKNSSFPRNYYFANSGKAVVMVEFIIDEEGRVEDARVAVPFHPEFDKIALSAIRNSPKWKPAIEHHVHVKSYFRQPVTFHQIDE